MRVYISGPINGKENGNREQFTKYEELFKAAGHEVVNPHSLDHSHEGPCHGRNTSRLEDPHRYGCYLLADLKALATCDAIFMMPHWQASPGARAESAYASACGLLFVPAPSCRCHCHDCCVPLDASCGDCEENHP